ncbi:hypothetical protein BJ508DRAFT_351134 [Ascobolus immersus RN42]|uniref:H-type lectin domain-containing protein n=1 Tax=Ascobolus immersus RN42 TaxID=1160509 RepID=A0A3N4IN91_ASCIM|nr:hypothetical protein BJ508DRAFT_351134 [Ascobolus immersus RN42]
MKLNNHADPPHPRSPDSSIMEDANADPLFAISTKLETIKSENMPPIVPRAAVKQSSAPRRLIECTNHSEPVIPQTTESFNVKEETVVVVPVESENVLNCEKPSSTQPAVKQETAAPEYPVIGSVSIARPTKYACIIPVKFEKPYDSAPAIALSLIGFKDTDGSRYTHFRAWGSATNVRPDGFSIEFSNIVSRMTTSASFQWMAISQAQQDWIQTGEWIARDNSGGVDILPNPDPTIKETISSTVVFSKPFESAPEIAVWLSGLCTEILEDAEEVPEEDEDEDENMDGQPCEGLKVFAEDATSTGFTLKLTTESSVRLANAKVTWVAFDSTKQGICAGTSSTDEVKPNGIHQHYNTSYAKFEEGKLKKAPDTIIGLNQLHWEIGDDRAQVLDLSISNVSPYVGVGFSHKHEVPLIQFNQDGETLYLRPETE